jgi:hypothetical protein
MNFSESRLLEAENRFVRSQIDVVCVDEWNFVVAEAQFPLFDLIENENLCVMLKSLQGINAMRLQLRVTQTVDEIIKHAQKSHSLVNNRLVKVP